MDAGLDNANNATNNPFANSNGTEILSQKEGFLLNLTDGFKQQNGSEISPTNEYLFERSTNGKRPADEFDEDEDMGPETDIDAVDDISLSPSTEHTTKTMSENKADDSFDPFAADLDEKATFELDLNLQKQQTSEFEPARTPREETPTPPADEVHDVGLEENVGDSGEDSEDEWNYYKGDTAEKESISKADLEVAKITEAEENSEAMSQLNPDAAEFIPIASPTRSTASPACRGLINETVIAQSPRRVTPTEIDINLPNPQEFEKEVKSRPSDVYSNGDESDGDHKLTSQEVMENFLNGKNIDEIEFHPSTPSKFPNPDEFHFGPNAAPFSTPAKILDQSEATLSTKAVFGDESATYLEGKSLAFESAFIETGKSFQSEDTTQDFQSLSKEQDPMSTSFYQDKSDNESDVLDLNKVQVLPDNIDDYLQKQTLINNNPFNETISDLPEHNPLEDVEAKDKTTPIEVEVVVTQRSPDLLTPEPEELIPPKSPLEDDVCRLKSPGVPSPEPEDDVCQLPPPKSPELLASKTPEPVESKSPELLAPKTPDDSTSQSPEPTDEFCKSSAPLTPEPTEEDLRVFTSKSPVAALTAEPTRDYSPEPTEDASKPAKPEEELLSKSPAASPEPIGDVCDFMSKSPGVLTLEPSDDVCTFKSKSPFEDVFSKPSPIEDVLSKSPVALTPEPTEDVCRLTSKSPAVEDVLSKSTPVALTPEPTDEILSKSSPVALTPEPTENILSKSSPVALTPEPTEDIVCKLTSKSPEPEDVVCKLTSKSPVPEDVCQLTSSKSPAPEPTEDVCQLTSKSPAPEPTEDVCQLTSKSLAPEPTELVSSKSSPEPTEDVCQFTSKSPVSLEPEPTDDVFASKSPVPLLTPEPSEDVCKLASKSPVAITPEPTEDFRSSSPGLFELEVAKMSGEVADLLGGEIEEDLCRLSSKSPIAAFVPEPSDLLCQVPTAKSPVLNQDFEQLVKTPDSFEEFGRKEVPSPEPKALVSSKSPPVLESPESALEDITSSVKDDVASPITSPSSEEIQQISSEAIPEPPVGLSFAQELSSEVQDVITNEISSPLEEKAPSEQVETESVATTDVNSFLERSNLTDVTSPLSPSEPPTLLQEQLMDTHINDPFSKCVYPLPYECETIITKREVIEPEFPIKEITTPSEETPETVAVPKEEKQEAPAASEEANAESKVGEVAAAVAAATAVAIGAGVAVAAANEKKPKITAAGKPTATRKAAAKPSTSPVKAPAKTTTSRMSSSVTSPTKPAPTARASKTSVSPKTSSAKAPVPPAKPPVSKPAAPKPRPSPTASKPLAERKSLDEKKLVNGEVKTTTSRLYAARKPATSSAPSSASKTGAPRTSSSTTPKLSSPTKTSTTDGSKTGSLTARPATAPGKTATTRTTTATTLGAAPKPRPTSLTTRTSAASSSTTTKASSTVSTTKSTTLTKTTTATSPRTATAKPRTTTTTTLHNRTTAAKPAAPKGAPDTEKQLKETANKQLTASRTTSGHTKTAAGKTTTTTLRKTESKTVPGTISTKTTITTIKSAKKPLEITRNVGKIKTTTTKTTKVEQNGLTNGITVTQETTAIISSDPQMIKDLSPVVDAKLITDNSQLPEANFAD